MKNKKCIILFLAFSLVFTNLFTTVSMASTIENSSEEYVIIDGKKVFFKVENKNGVNTATAKNENGQVLSEVSIDFANNEAVIDGVKLSDEEYDNFSLISEEIVKENNNKGLLNRDLISEKESNEYQTYAACTYKKIGSTRKTSTWIPKATVTITATFLVAKFPGMAYAGATAVAGAAAGLTNTLYYTVDEYSCQSGGTYHLKTTRTFYKNSNYTGYLYQFSVYGSRR